MMNMFSMGCGYWRNNMLNAYVVYSRGATAAECAGLVFAHSVQEARKIGWRSIGSDFTDDYLDFAANILRDHPWLFEEADKLKLANDIPHVIVCPKSCEHCEQWGWRIWKRWVLRRLSRRT
jgi:hypothetical protein